MRFPLTVKDNKPRECGGCNACCTAVGVGALNKPMWTRCEHACDKGCAVYEQRPDECRTYYCLWQAGFLEGDERRRPDRLGVIFDLQHHSHEDELDVITGWEVVPGAIDRQDVQWLIRSIAQRMVVMIRRHSSTTKMFIAGPEHLAEKVRSIIQKKGATRCTTP